MSFVQRGGSQSSRQSEHTLLVNQIELTLKSQILNQRNRPGLMTNPNENPIKEMKLQPILLNIHETSRNS
jgi:hypothetical protein